MVLLEFFLQNPWLLSAFFAGAAASVAGGIVGCYVVIQRLVSLSGSISHAVLGGVGFALFLKHYCGWEAFSVLHGALLAGVTSALWMGGVQRYYQERSDTMIAALWSAGMSLGLVLIALVPSANMELIDFLFGNILWVSQQELRVLVGLDFALIATVWMFFPYFYAVCFDEEHAKLQGVNVSFFCILLLLLIAVSIVLLMQIVGALLVISLLAMPAAIASTWTNRLSTMMCLAVVFGVFFSFGGLLLAYLLNWPVGATITLTTVFFYLVNLCRCIYNHKKSSIL